MICVNLCSGGLVLIMGRDEYHGDPLKTTTEVVDLTDKNRVCETGFVNGSSGLFMLFAVAKINDYPGISFISSTFDNK